VLRGPCTSPTRRGRLDIQIESITDAVELPYLHRKLFTLQLPARRASPLRPPGAQDLISKAVATRSRRRWPGHRQHEVAQLLLEHQARAAQQTWARPSARSPGVPACPEKAERRAVSCSSTNDSLFRTRGPVSADMESPSCPSCCRDRGVEALRDVIVIGASNRET